MNMISEILDEYTLQLDQEDICYKNNRSKEHDWEAVNREHISRNIIETEYYCCFCGNLKYLYSYLEDSEIGL